MQKDTSKITQNDSARKVRPTVQLYCPRMLRNLADGENSTKKKNEKVPESVKLVRKFDSKNLELNNDKENGGKKGGRRDTLNQEFVHDRLWQRCDENERNYIFKQNDYYNLNRKQSGNGSSFSSKQVADFRKSQKNAINKSCDHLVESLNSCQKKRLYSGSSNLHSSSQSLCEHVSGNSHGHSHDNSSMAYSDGKTPCDHITASDVNLARSNNINSISRRGRNTTRNSRWQHRFDYRSGDVRRNSSKHHALHGKEQLCTDESFVRCIPLDRQQNWSFRSSKSDRFNLRYRYQNTKSSGLDCKINAVQNNKSIAKMEVSKTECETPSKHKTFEDFCASFDSFDLSSFDWSSAVEAEEQRKKEREQSCRKQKDLLCANPCSSRKESTHMSRMRKHVESVNSYRNTGDCSQSHSGHAKTLPISYENNKSHRLLLRQRNDSVTIQTSNSAENIEENDVESIKEVISVSTGKTATSHSEENKSSEKEMDEEVRIINQDCESARTDKNCDDTNDDSDNQEAKKCSDQWQTNGTASIACKSKTWAAGESKIMRTVLLKKVSQEHPSSSSDTKTFSAEVSYEPAPERIVKSDKYRQELPPTQWPIHSKISNNEGPQIQSLNDAISRLIDRIAESADFSAGEEILVVSEMLSKVYLSIVTKDIDYTYTMNLEQHLWKQCFYTCIEALRAASNSTGNASRIFRTSLFNLIQQGLSFYALLFNEYEVKFGFVIDDYLYWGSGLPADDFASCILTSSRIRETADYNVKVALLSAQRFAVSVGDLHRYNAMVSGSKDYSLAKLWYLKATQLAAGNGRSYNQLALLAVYTTKWIDVIFYYVRALAARYPFETARQPLFTALNHVRKKVNEFEIDFNTRIGNIRTREAETSAARADRPQEIWIAQDGKLSSGDYANITDHKAVHILSSVSNVELYRRTIPYVLHTAGLLITKIGMEEYDSISERALFQLSQLISCDECPLSSLHLVQLCTLFLYAVHSLTLKNTEPGTCSLQQQQAVQMVLSLFGVVLSPIYDHLQDLSNILIGSAQLPLKMRRVLPAVFVISEWLSMPSVNRLYRSMPSLESIETSLIQVDTWKLLADVANFLVEAESQKILSRTIPCSDVKSEVYIELVLPESIFLASFIDVFTVLPKSLRMSVLKNVDLSNNLPLLALHARLSSVLSAAEYLDGSELPCFRFSEHLRCFAVVRSDSPVNYQTKQEKNSDELYEASELKHEVEVQDFDQFSDEHKQYRQTVLENQIKQELLERETKGNRVIIEVRPKYLVPDTNTFIDHLVSIKKIVDSHRFTVLVPTTVVSELENLSRLVSSKSSFGVEEFQDCYVGERAKEAIVYLKDLVGKQSQVYTITSRGNLLNSVMFATEESYSSGELTVVNDDIILLSCVNFAKTRSNPPSSSEAQLTTGSLLNVEQPVRLYRSVVLLTEDRALNIKAVCENMPCRTIPSFMKWACLD